MPELLCVHMPGDNEIYIYIYNQMLLLSANGLKHTNVLTNKYSLQLVNVYAFDYETCSEIFVKSCPQLLHYCGKYIDILYHQFQ